jgi:DNA-binding NtrC family response regulator
MGIATVLIVDDEVEFSSVIAERLRTRGFDADTAENGPAGIQKIQAKAYDAIVMDLAMPGMDGIETMKKMLAIDANLQIIILTGQGSIQKGVQAVKEGAVDFLEKPADIDALTGKITEAQLKKMALFEEDLEKRMNDLMRNKGW